MHVKSGFRAISLPAALTEPMRLKIACPTCECRYGVIGSAFFCPACGHNAAEHVFAQSLGTIRASLDAVESVRLAIADRDAAENTCRLLVESSLQGGITAFQRFAEALLERHANPPKVRRNVFQNLADGSDVWKAVYGASYDMHLNQGERETLGRYFQQRHLLAHKEGIVDEDYIARAGDQSYRAGQRLVIRESRVRECVDLIEKLARDMAHDANEGLLTGDIGNEGSPL